MVLDDGVVLHDYAHALISSQVFAFNLFLPFRVWGTAILESVLSAAVGESVTVGRITFEYAGDLDVLAEVDPDRGATDCHTASDVGVEVRTADGRRGLVLIEVKCTEGGFSTCNGRTSTGNRTRNVCASAERFFADPHRCYLTRPWRARRARRYWEILASEYGSVGASMPGWDRSRPCPFAGDHQQVMRNHALALGMVQAGYVDVAWFGLVHHDDNPDVVLPFEEYRETCGTHPGLFRLPASRLVTAGTREWASWGQYIAARYALRSG
jgi:hypothetical protein